MIGLLIGTSVAAGTAFGWYGHKASLRIEAWGQRANERDRIVRRLIGQDEEFPRDWNGAYDNAPFVRPLGTPHFPA